MMKLILKFALLALLAFAAHAGEVTFEGTKPQAIIDVRTPAEFAAGHIDGAVNIPYEGIAQGIGALKDLSKDSAILLYCQSGRRAGVAKATLEHQGYTKVINGGGIAALEKALKLCPAQGC
jgi:phage shock protein E